MMMLQILKTEGYAVYECYYFLFAHYYVHMTVRILFYVDRRKTNE